MNHQPTSRHVVLVRLAVRINAFDVIEVILPTTIFVRTIQPRARLLRVVTAELRLDVAVDLLAEWEPRLQREIDRRPLHVAAVEGLMIAKTEAITRSKER